MPWAWAHHDFRVWLFIPGVYDFSLPPTGILSLYRPPFGASAPTIATLILVPNKRIGGSGTLTKISFVDLICYSGLGSFCCSTGVSPIFSRIPETAIFHFVDAAPSYFQGDFLRSWVCASQPYPADSCQGMRQSFFPLSGVLQVPNRRIGGSGTSTRSTYCFAIACYSGLSISCCPTGAGLTLLRIPGATLAHFVGVTHDVFSRLVDKASSSTCLSEGGFFRSRVYVLPPYPADSCRGTRLSYTSFSGVLPVPNRRIGGSGTSTRSTHCPASASQVLEALCYALCSVIAGFGFWLGLSRPTMRQGPLSFRAFETLRVYAAYTRFLTSGCGPCGLFDGNAGNPHCQGSCYRHSYSVGGGVCIFSAYIGFSGSYYLAVQGPAASFLPWVEQQAVSVGLIWAATLLASLLCVLFRHMGFTASPLGKGCLLCLADTPCHACKGMIFGIRGRVVITESPGIGRSGCRAVHKRSSAHASAGLGLSCSRWILRLFSLPVACSSGGLGLPLWAAAPFIPCAGAMDDSSLQDRSMPGQPRRPHDIPVEELVQHTGPAVVVPSHAPLRLPFAGDEAPWLLVYPGPREPPINPGGGHNEDVTVWLGVNVYTPHVRTVSVAVRGFRHSPLQHYLDVVKDAAPGVDVFAYDVCVPLRPQRFDTYCEFLRFPSVIHYGAGPALAAVAVDLSFVGGHYYACTLLRQLPYEDFVAFITPQTCHDDEPLAIYIGEALQPHEVGRPLTLQDGVVIAVMRSCHTRFQHRTADAIVSDPARWGPLEHLPIRRPTPELLIQFRGDQFVWPRHFFYGRTVVEAIAERFRCDINNLTFCSFATPNLELHGESCSHIIAVVELPPDQLEPTRRPRRRDHFALCDFRELGRKVWVHHSHVGAFHLPSLAAIHDVRLPRGHSLAVDGAEMRGDEALVNGHAVLKIFCIPSSSDDDEPDVPPGGDSHSEGGDDANRPASPSGEQRTFWPQPLIRARSRSRSGEQVDRAGISGGSRRAAAMVPSGAGEPCYHYIAWLAQQWALTFLSIVLQAGCKRSPWQSWQPGKFVYWGGHGLTAPVCEAGMAAANDGQGRTVCASEVTVAPVPSRVKCFIYTPGYVPDIVLPDLPLPCSIQQAQGILDVYRDESQARCFDTVLPVAPQPFRQVAIWVASPSWVTDRIAALCSCLAIDGRLFAVALPSRIKRESLLRAAGFQPEADHQVFIHGLLHPVAPDVLVDVQPGSLVIFTPAGVGPPDCWPLHDMLLDPTEWDADWSPPEVTLDAPDHFYVLTDGMPQVVGVQPGQRQAVTQVVVDQLGYQAFKTTLKATIPRVRDMAFLGFPIASVLVATDALQTVPCPPARQPESRQILILDCRGVLQGFQWILIPGPAIKVQEIADKFGGFCPLTHLVVVHGADIHEGVEGFELRPVHGQVVKVEFVGETDSGSSPSGGSFQPGGSDSEFNSDESSSVRSPAGTPGVTRTRSPSSNVSLRSRTPRNRMRHAPLEPLRLCENIPLLEVHIADGLARSLGSPGLRGSTGNISAPFLCLVYEFLRRRPALHIFYRTLEEPTPISVTGRQDLATLRFLAGQMQEVWRYVPSDDAMFLGDEDDSGSSLVLSEDEVQWIHFAILVPGYTAERLVIGIRLPATIGEAITAVQAAREASQRARFPVILVAHPQPCAGTGVLLANPAWREERCALCLDTSAIDGRIFSLPGPSYADKRTLIHLANLPYNLAVDVYVGDDDTPLSATDTAHLYAGCTVTCIAQARDIIPRVSLGYALSRRSGWGVDSTLPSVAAEGTFGLVHEDESILFIMSLHNPTTYRDQIARCIGVPVAGLRLYPSAPRVTDAAIDGMPCRTIIAACHVPGADDRHRWGALIDARPVGLSWFAVMVQGGVVDRDGILARLEVEPPPGWQYVINHPDAQVDHVHLQPGQVVQVQLCRALQTDTDSEAQSAVNYPDGDADVSYASGPAGGIDEDTQDGLRPQDVNVPLPREGSYAAAAAGHDNPVHAVEDSLGICNFLVLGQDYTTELIQVRLPFGISVPDALKIAAAARTPYDAMLRPSLWPVYPQTGGPFALVIGAPDWVGDGAFVAFDCSAVGGQYFALKLPSKATREGLIAAAGVIDGATVSVYVGDGPDPVPYGSWTDLPLGTLVTVLPNPSPPWIAVGLADMLRNPAMWAESFVPSGHYTEAAWYITNSESFRFIASPERRGSVCRDVATRLRTPVEDLAFRPAAPPIVDHSSRGEINRNVIATCLRSDCPEPGSRRPKVVFIDMRALWRGISWQFCADDCFHLSRLRDRLEAGCPEGFEPCVLVKDRHITDLATVIRPVDGLALVCFYRPVCDASRGRFNGSNPEGEQTLHSRNDDTDDDDDFFPSRRFVVSLSPELTRSGVTDHGRGGAGAVMGVGLQRTDMQRARTMSVTTDVRPNPCDLHSAAHKRDYGPPCRCVPRDATRSAASPGGLRRWLIFLVAADCQVTFIEAIPQVFQLDAEEAATSAVTKDAVPVLHQRCLPTPCRARCATPAVDTRQNPYVRGTWREHAIRTEPHGPSSRVVLSIGAQLQMPGRRVIDWPKGLCLPPRVAAAADILGSDYDRGLAYNGVTLGFTPRQMHELFRPSFNTLSARDCVARLGPAHGARMYQLLCLPTESFPDTPICFTDGSYVPPGVAQGPSSGWACVFINKAQQTCDILAGALPSWCYEGGCQSAFKAECCALIVALWLGTAVWAGSAYDIATDCQAALAIARGDAAVHTKGVARVLAHVAGCCRDASAEGPTLRYIPGHRDIAGNEIADVAAKAAAADRPLGFLSWQIPGGPDWWQDQGCMWAWAGTVCRWARGDDALPSPIDSSLFIRRDYEGMTPEDMVRPFLPDNQPPAETESGCISFTAVSYNALSLAVDKKGPKGEGLAFQPARPALLAKQLKDAGVHFAAIQEARTEAGFLTTGSFLRYSSGACKGHLGVELWFRARHTVLSFEDKSKAPVIFEPRSFVVLAKDPRRLVMLFKQQGLQVVFASLHAPHRGAPETELNSWWRETEDILFRFARGRLLVVGADCNASLGSVESDSVSFVGAEEQDLSGELLHSILHKCELWAPATWSGVQVGPTWTFAQRRNGALARPDFILLPLCWKQGQITAQTVPGITAANMVLDHVATQVQVSTRIRCQAFSTARVGPKVDVKALEDPRNKEVVAKVLRDAPRPRWEAAASAHVAIVTNYLQDALSKAFPKRVDRPLHPYLSDDAWQLQKHVAWLRRKCVSVRTMIYKQTLAGVFYAWRDGPCSDAPSAAWLKDAQAALALYGFRLGAYASALRARCKTDRARYMESLADEVQANKPTAFVAADKLLHRRRKKPFAPAVLPAILDADGGLCVTPGDTIKRWRTYFSAMEDGLEVERADLLKLSNEAVQGTWPVPPSIQHIPAPADLRNSILAAKRGKACGPDALPGEIGLLCADELQRILYPLLLKLGLLGEEGIGHKSGSLTWLWKGRGSQAECTSYRGILLLSNLCKAMHRAYRPRIQAHFEASAAPLQLGGRKGGSVVFGSHIMRTFMRVRARQGLSSAVLFADVSSAYYSTVRDLASRMPCAEPASSTDPADKGDELSVEVQLEHQSALAQDGADPWLRALTARINGGTWMCLQGDTVPVLTRRGTRPGSAWADLTFGVLLKRIIALRDECKRGAKAACDYAVLQWDGFRDWRPLQQNTAEVPLQDLIWADDIASCLPVPHANSIASAVGLEAGALADAFEGHSLNLSFGERKTAALVCPRGQGARAARRALFGGKPEIPVLRENGLVSLPLVDTYKHLGVLQASEGNIRPEVRQRCSSAWVAFREGRTRIFRCRRISLKRRGALLQTLVLSKLLFGAGAWPPLDVSNRKTLAGTLFSLYRSTLGLGVKDDQHVSITTMCALLGLPDYESLLHVERLRYLRQLCTHAPDAVWALVRQDAPYMELLRASLQWLFCRIRATSTLPDPLSDWQPWCDLISTRPTLFKGLVQRAKGLEQCRITCYAAMQAVHAAICQQGQGKALQASAYEEKFQEACLVCKRGFLTRSAWACHASKLHGYRIAASVLAGSDGGTLCQACGKSFSKPARLRRHLLHSEHCRKSWGNFRPSGGLVPRPHERAPPLTVEGVLAGIHEDRDPAAFNKGLFEALSSLVSPDTQQIWDTIVDFIEPISILRDTVRLWADNHGHDLAVKEAAEDAVLLLDPELVCDSFCRRRSVPPVADCCPELPGQLDFRLSFVLSGDWTFFTLDPAPCPAFAYPFLGGAPLARAAKQTAYLEYACDIIGQFVQGSSSSRVFLQVPRTALGSLEPIPTWLLAVGFVLLGTGISSPEA